jgi:L,D-transpeptidase YcbB
MLALSCHPSQAQQQMSDQKIDAAIPMPDTRLPPPLTAQDVGAIATEKKIEAAVPVPDTRLPPPLTAQDVGATATEKKIEAAVPVPDTRQLPPLTVKDVAAVAPSPTGEVAVAESLRDLIAHRLDRYVARKPDREGVEAYYKAHDFQPIWVSDGAANARAKAAIAYLAQVETVGLNPSDYPTPDFAAAKTPESLAQDELKLTEAALTYARHAQIGQINFTRVGADISFKLDPPEPAEVLAKLAEAKDTAAALDSYNPPQQGFKALREKLAELRAGKLAKPASKAEVKQVRVPEGKILRPGMKDPRVIALRQRLDVPGDKDNPLYDQAVFEAVKAFQTQAEIGVDGMLGPNTVRALNGRTAEAHHAPANPIDTILVNMERWRWLPRKLGNSENTYVMVNVPDYTLSLYHDGRVIWKTKIVAGKPDKATPMTTAEMKYITVNPTWNVPPSIVENEYLPALQQDPTVLDRYGLKIYQDPDGTVHIYQPPGAANALGRIRFNFPNKFLVYQHDTPDKYLFARVKRAYSHGCMRVQDPLEYATKLLGIELPQDHYTPAKLQSMYGDNEININFPKPIPVHLTYQTAFVDQDGKLQFRDDVYGRDARMIAILKSNSERRVADIAIERPPNMSDKPVRLPVGTYADRAGDKYSDSSNGPSFFDFLFGGARAAAPQPYNRRNPRAGYNGPHYVR